MLLFIQFEISLQSKMTSEHTFGGLVVFREKCNHFLFDTVDNIDIIISEMNDDSIESLYLLNDKVNI